MGRCKYNLIKWGLSDDGKYVHVVKFKPWITSYNAHPENVHFENLSSLNPPAMECIKIWYGII
jgi:hypothetical protein